MKNRTANILIGIVALILAAVIVIGLGSSWFTNPNFSTWFNSWGKGKTETSADEPEDETEDKGKEDKPVVIVDGAGGTVSDVVDGKGISLLSTLIPVEAYSDNGVTGSVVSAYTVTATIEPEDVTERDLVWSLVFSEKNGSWGNVLPSEKGNVENYVSLNVNGLSATVTLKKPFGSQIILTVASKNYRDVSATVTFDYIARSTLKDVSITDYLAFSLPFYDGETLGTPNYSFSSDVGIGSVFGEFELTSATIQFTKDVWHEHDSDFQSAASTLYGFAVDHGWGINIDPLRFNPNPIPLYLRQDDLKIYMGLDYKKFFTFGGPGIGVALGGCPEAVPYLKSYLNTYCESASGADMGTITLSGTYSYGEYYSQEVSCTIAVKRWLTSSLVVPPSAVVPDNDSFYF